MQRVCQEILPYEASNKAVIKQVGEEATGKEAMDW
jgi:hypothetical protein